MQSLQKVCGLIHVICSNRISHSSLDGHSKFLAEQVGPVTGITRETAMHTQIQPSMASSVSEDKLEAGQSSKPSPVPASTIVKDSGTAGLVLRGFACFACAGFVAFVVAFGVTSMWWHPSSTTTITSAPAAPTTSPPVSCQFLGSRVQSPRPPVPPPPSASRRRTFLLPVQAACGNKGRGWGAPLTHVSCAAAG